MHGFLGDCSHASSQVIFPCTSKGKGNKTSEYFFGNGIWIFSKLEKIQKFNEMCFSVNSLSGFFPNRKKIQDSGFFPNRKKSKKFGHIAFEKQICYLLHDEILNRLFLILSCVVSFASICHNISTDVFDFAQIWGGRVTEIQQQFDVTICSSRLEKKLAVLHQPD